MHQDKPTFRPIRGYPRYFINSKGEVFNINIRTVKPKLVKPKANRSGVLVVSIKDSTGAFKRRRVSELVLQTYKPDEHPEKYVIHKDYDLTNCSPENLSWADKRTHSKHEWDKPRTPKLIRYIGGERVETLL